MGSKQTVCEKKTFCIINELKMILNWGRKLFFSAFVLAAAGYEIKTNSGIYFQQVYFTVRRDKKRKRRDEKNFNISRMLQVQISHEKKV